MQELEAKLREEEQERKRMQAKAAQVSCSVSRQASQISYTSLCQNKRFIVDFLDHLYFGGVYYINSQT